MRRFLALTRKEALQVGRDPSSILIAFVLPLILLFLFGYGVSLDATSIRVGLVLPSTEDADDLAAALTASDGIEVTTARDRRDLTGALVAGEIRGIVVIPDGFRAGDPIQVLTDGSEPNTARFVENYVRGIVQSWIAGEAGRPSPPSIAVDQRYWFNPGLESRYFLVPGSIALVMSLIGTLLTALVVSREWERGTMEAMLATPVSPVELLLGKFVPYLLLGLGSMAICTMLAVWLFGVPLRGSIPALVAISAAFLVPALGQGLIISALSKNQFVASQLALLSGFLPATLLSGFIFEIDSMPQVIQWITVVVPARYLIPSLQTVFLAGDIWPLFLGDIAAMLAIGMVFMGLAANATRKRLA